MLRRRRPLRPGAPVGRLAGTAGPTRRVRLNNEGKGLTRMYRSWLTARCQPDQREALIDAFRKRQVLQECAAHIPGFVRGELLCAEHDRDLICISVTWQDRSAFEQWQQSPVRAAQLPDLL
ncbi:MAG: antibiotic biosynthesis monooxygenase, partial [Betaproteobacteria bacterium]|nr:antibiotic biosynthesis monooxygenase [Betaproteobacteria bacterium]